MRTLLAPLTAGLGVIRHLGWYLSYRVAGPRSIGDLDRGSDQLR